MSLPFCSPLFSFHFVGDVELWPLQGIGPLAPSLPPLPEGVTVQPERKRRRSDRQILGACMRRLQAKKKGKGVVHPVESGEGPLFPMAQRKCLPQLPVERELRRLWVVCHAVVPLQLALTSRLKENALNHLL